MKLAILHWTSADWVGGQAGITIECMRGRSAHRDVLVGFAPANILYSYSFSDVLDEDSGRGYQRRFNGHRH